jgi:hypothetical protein
MRVSKEFFSPERLAVVLSLTPCFSWVLQDGNVRKTVLTVFRLED